MEVNNYLSNYLYSSYCKNLQYDEYLHQYKFKIDAITENDIENIKSNIFNSLNKNVSFECIRSNVNNLLHETSHPVFKKEQVYPCILFSDLIAGEIIRLALPHDRKCVELIKYNDNSWLILKSDTPMYIVGNFIEIDSNTHIYDWLDSCEKTFIFSGHYHDNIDKIYLKGLSKNNVANSIAPLYEKLLESHNRNQICQEWKSILAFSEKLGFGSYVVRRLLDSITIIRS